MTEKGKEDMKRAAQHLADSINKVITAIKQNENRNFGSTPQDLNKNLVFVIMPFNDPELTNIYKNIIKPTVESFGLNCRRADDCEVGVNIVRDCIWPAICKARFIIAELTGSNANVYYELGIGHALDKVVIPIFKGPKGAELQSDLAGVRRIRYENTDPGLKRLKTQLSKWIQMILTTANN